MSGTIADVRFDLEDPFGPAIRTALFRDFPAAVTGKRGDVESAVLAEVLGSGKHRFGPMPNVESQSSMLQVVRMAIKRGVPIPMLCPWGSKKPGNEGIVDVAELSGLRTLQCLQSRVTQFYTPGLDIRVRLEDVGGFYLFRDEGEAARTSSKRYVADFEKLVKILGLRFIETVREGQLTTEEEYVRVADALYPKVLAYLVDTDRNGLAGYETLDSWKALSAEGWMGEIPLEQRGFYYQRYARIYGSDTEIQVRKLAEYLAGSLARYKLKATGPRDDWGRNFIQLNFAPPAPGAPQGIIERRIHYRTLSTEFTRDHLPSWRARGFYRFKPGSEVPSPALASWFAPTDNFEAHVVTLEGGGLSVRVATPYVVL